MSAGNGAITRVMTGDELLRDTANRLFTENCTSELVREAEANPWPQDLWSLVSESGLPWIGIGGSDGLGTILDAAEVLHACGRFAVPLPIAETGLIGGNLIRIAGFEVEEVAVTVPVPHLRDRVELTNVSEGWRLTAHWHCVPWATEAHHLVTALKVAGGSEYVVLLRSPVSAVRGHNVAGEPRDEVVVDQVIPRSEVVEVPEGTVDFMHLLGALSRSLLVGGALERSAEMAVGYSRERHQFGKPLSSFQAIQHHLAFATEYAATSVLAAWVAAAAMTDDPTDPVGKVAISRVVSHESVEVVTARTHQVFGAIGMTREHDLHFRTRRCWSWTHEWGSGTYWADLISRGFLNSGADELWSTMTGGGVR